MRIPSGLRIACLPLCASYSCRWQLDPKIWNHVRRAVDDRRATGQFILTGSAIPGDDATRHTGMRRVARLLMRPMSLHEMGRSSGAVSLARLLAGGSARAGQHTIPSAEVAELISHGGWPESVDWPLDRALRANRNQLDEVARVEVQGVDGVRRDPQRVKLLLRSLGRNVGTAVAVSKLAADLGEGGNGAIKPHTAADGFLGLLFESLVVRDLRVYAQAADADVYHYRENGRLEVDAVVQARDGRWAAFEVKLSPRMVEGAAGNLLRLKARVDPESVGPPQALGVIVASGYAYTRPDGVSVIPVGALGP